MATVKRDSDAADLATWHRILGHLGDTMLKKLVTSETTKGLDMTDTHLNGICESMLMTITLNNIETNQDIKYKHITYRMGTGKTFLDKVAIVAEDVLCNFEFSQVYTNWLMLIKMVLDPVIEQGWHAHHKRMVLDRGFQDWAQAWHAHDQLLCSQFMLKPFIIDPSSAAYKKQFKHSKLDQALLGVCRSPH